MKPNVGDLKVNKVLSEFSLMVKNEDYIADQWLPVVRVSEKAGNFAKYGKEQFRTGGNTIFRAPGTRATTVDYSVSFGDYACKERALEKAVPMEMYDNVDDPLDPERDALEILKAILRNNQEYTLAQAMSNTSLITRNVTLSGTDQWTATSTSDPIADINTGINTMRSVSGKRPNTLTISEYGLMVMKNHPAIREQLKYTNGGQPSDEETVTWIKKYFNFKNVYVGSAVYETADIGQTSSLGNIWGNHVWLSYRPDRPSMMVAMFGATLVDVPDQVDVRYDNDIIANIVRARYSYDMNIMNTDLVYLIKDIA